MKNTSAHKEEVPIQPKFNKQPVNVGETDLDFIRHPSLDEGAESQLQDADDSYHRI